MRKIRCPFSSRDWRLTLGMLGFYEGPRFNNEKEVRMFFRVCMPRPKNLAQIYVEELVQLVLEHEEHMCR